MLMRGSLFTQIFLDTFVCQSNAAGIGYFYFEVREPCLMESTYESTQARISQFTDEVWKDEQFGGVEVCHPMVPTPITDADWMRFTGSLGSVLLQVRCRCWSPVVLR